MPRLVVIGVIWLGCSIGWWILGSSLALRSDQSIDARGAEVFDLWGGPLHVEPARASYQVASTRSETKTVQENGKKAVTTTVTHPVVDVRPIPLESSRVEADFELEPRKRGLLWFSTYAVDFSAVYAFRNPSDRVEKIRLALSLDPTMRTYDGLVIQDGDGTPIAFEIADGTVRWSQLAEPNSEIRALVSYRTRGTDSWTYAATADGDETRNFALLATTDFPNVDFPSHSVSPTTHDASGDAWSGEWVFDSLITNSPMGIRMPQRLNPGPLASRITLFAPVSLLFFFFVISMMSLTSRRELHPMHYFLLGCGFFAFHLLFAYSVDHVSLIGSFLISALVSMFLVVTYVRLFVGWRFALRRIAPIQLVYLVLFSASFFWDGYTGLAITIGAILTLFAVMQRTGRVDWNELFARRKALGPSAKPT
ncbi:MAG: inner membrane CreD family protein [Myxococcota bacterium]